MKFEEFDKWISEQEHSLRPQTVVNYLKENNINCCYDVPNYIFMIIDSDLYSLKVVQDEFIVEKFKFYRNLLAKDTPYIRAIPKKVEDISVFIEENNKDCQILYNWIYRLQNVNGFLEKYHFDKTGEWLNPPKENENGSSS